VPLNAPAADSAPPDETPATGPAGTAVPRASRALVALATLAFALSQANLARLLAPLDPSIFALQLAFTPEAFWRVVDAWGPAGVAVYRAHFAFDNLHPFLYGAFGYLAVSRTRLFSRPAGRLYHGALLALPVAGLCDLIENAIHLWLLAHAHGTGGLLVPLSGTCSLLKWGLALFFTLALAGRLLVVLTRPATRPGPPAPPIP